jgi:hypothetical protein
MSNIWILHGFVITRINEIKLIEQDVHAEKDDAIKAGVICYTSVLEAIPALHESGEPIIPFRLFEMKMIDQFAPVLTHGNDFLAANTFWEERFKFTIEAKDRQYILSDSNEKKLFMSKAFARIVHQINQGRDHVIDKMTLAVEIANEIVNKRKDREPFTKC